MRYWPQYSSGISSESQVLYQHSYPTLVSLSEIPFELQLCPWREMVKSLVIKSASSLLTQWDHCCRDLCSISDQQTSSLFCYLSAEQAWSCIMFVSAPAWYDSMLSRCQRVWARMYHLIWLSDRYFYPLRRKYIYQANPNLTLNLKNLNGEAWLLNVWWNQKLKWDVTQKLNCFT